MSAFGKVIGWNDGKPARMVGVMFDITEGKNLQQKKEDFLGIASHELKTPVTSIKIYAELIEDILRRHDEIENTGLLTKLNQQIDRLTSLINDLLDSTRADEGKIEYRKTSFDITGLLKEKAEEMQRVAGTHHIHLHSDTSAMIYADRERIGQVVTNFLSNAIKYSVGESDIHVFCHAAEKEVAVSVQDKGIGIPATAIDKIFERFYRVDTAAMGNYPGLGLGLYISAEIIKNHHGTITVESKEGEGSVFRFTLPVIANH